MRQPGRFQHARVVVETELLDAPRGSVADREPTVLDGVVVLGNPVRLPEAVGIGVKPGQFRGPREPHPAGWIGFHERVVQIECDKSDRSVDSLDGHATSSVVCTQCGCDCMPCLLDDLVSMSGDGPIHGKGAKIRGDRSSGRQAGRDQAGVRTELQA